MRWFGNMALTVVRASHSDVEIAVCLAEAEGGWWTWHASHQDVTWTPDVRWYAARVEAQRAAEGWAATLAERHVDFLCRRAQPQSLAA